jgi:hypothetical protein
LSISFKTETNKVSSLKILEAELEAEILDLLRPEEIFKINYQGKEDIH